MRIETILLNEEDNGLVEQIGIIRKSINNIRIHA